jgi:RimJ/RimL family protein N-acetyltransferase
MSDGNDAIVNIEGELVSLGPLRRDLIPLYLRWINDFGTTRTLSIQNRPMTLEEETAWFENRASASGEYVFTIYERSSVRPIGNCDLFKIDFRNRRGEVGQMIGEPKARGKGFGTEAMKLLLDFAFTALGLNTVMLQYYEFNPAARRCYEKAGFRESGRWRQSLWSGGRFWDQVFMDILSAEFESPVLRSILEPQPRRD